MKIAVYTICKNEAAFIPKWLASCKDADYILITDTGSTDETLALLEKANIEYNQFHFNRVYINPWRFDDARNFSLYSLPGDIDVCICLDMDEVLEPGWRGVIEREWHQGLDRLRYNYVWSWNPDETPGVTYHADKIHARHGLRWKHPVHEVLAKDSRLTTEVQKFISNTLIKHYPDNSKSRGNYLELLALSVQEDAQDDRNSHYYARELMFASLYDAAYNEFKRHLELPRAQWKPERSASMRYLGDCCWSLGYHAEAMEWFNKAIKECPEIREPYISLAQAYRHFKEWDGVVECCEKALAITERPNTYINQPSSWGSWPAEMLAEAQEQLRETKQKEKT